MVGWTVYLFCTSVWLTASKTCERNALSEWMGHIVDLNKFYDYNNISLMKRFVTWSSAEPRARATSANCMLSSEGKPACKSWYFDCCSSVMRSTLWRLLMTSPCAV